MRNGAENIWRLSGIYYPSEKSSKFCRTNTRPRLTRQARAGEQSPVGRPGPVWSRIC